MRRRNVKGKRKLLPLQAWSDPECSRKLRFPDFMTTAQEGGKVVSLTHRPHLPPGNSPGTHCCQRLSRPQGHSAIGRIMSMKNSSDTIWNRTSDLPICSTAEVQLYILLNLSAKQEWAVNVTPRPLYLREGPGTYCIGRWVGPRPDVDGLRIPRPHRNQILGLSVPKRVAIPAKLSRHTSQDQPTIYSVSLSYPLQCCYFIHIHIYLILFYVHDPCK